MKRMRGRNHRTGGGGGGGSGGGLRHHSGNIPLNRNHVFDSSGPDLRIRGTAQQLFEKYLQLGRDASSSGDRVMAESYFQHAEHYFRILNAMAQAAQANQQGQPQGQARDGQGREGQGREGQGREGQGRDGQGREGQMREHQGRDGQGRDGQVQNGNGYPQQTGNYPAGNRRNLYDQREGADMDDDQPDPLVPLSASERDLGGERSDREEADA